MNEWPVILWLQGIYSLIEEVKHEVLLYYIKTLETDPGSNIVSLQITIYRIWQSTLLKPLNFILFFLYLYIGKNNCSDGLSWNLEKININHIILHW